MALRLGARREALIDADASPDKAGEELASDEREFAGIKGTLQALGATQAILITLVVLLAGGELAIWRKLGEFSARLVH